MLTLVPKTQKVYFIEINGNGPIKIGITENVNQRLIGLRNASPYHLKLIGLIDPASKKLESRLHRKFAAHRIRGEWFEPSEEIFAYIGRHATTSLPTPKPDRPFREPLPCEAWRKKEYFVPKGGFASDANDAAEDMAIWNIAKAKVEDAESYKKILALAEVVAARKLWKSMHEKGMPIRQIAELAGQPEDHVERLVYTLLKFDP